MSDIKKLHNTGYSTVKPGEVEGPSATEMVNVIVLPPPVEAELKRLLRQKQEDTIAKFGLNPKGSATELRVAIHARMPGLSDRNAFDAMLSACVEVGDFYDLIIDALENIEKRQKKGK